MTYGEKPEANPSVSPVVGSYKANSIPGGLIFNMHSHHYSSDALGWGSFTKKLAENCHVIIHLAEYLTFDPRADRHPDHKVSQSLLIHLPKRKAAMLKEVAKPNDGTGISTYDAVAGLTWRVLSKIREPLYKPDPASKP